MRHLSRGDITTMLDYAQIHIFDVVTTCGHYQGRLLLILILHNVMHDITSTLPVGVIPSARWYAKWPPNVNRRRAPGVIWLGIGFTGYGKGLFKLVLKETAPSVHAENTARALCPLTRVCWEFTIYG